MDAALLAREGSGGPLLNYAANVNDRVPHSDPHVASRRLGDKGVLLHLESGRYFALERVGTRVWELCDGTKTIAAIAAAIAEEYDVEASVAERDVAELLSELERENLVRFD